MRAELKELQVHRGVEAGLELFISQSDQFSLSQDRGSLSISTSC